MFCVYSSSIFFSFFLLTMIYVFFLSLKFFFLPFYRHQISFLRTQSNRSRNDLLLRLSFRCLREKKIEIDPKIIVIVVINKQTKKYMYICIHVWLIQTRELIMIPSNNRFVNESQICMKKFESNVEMLYYLYLMIN